MVHLPNFDLHDFWKVLRTPLAHDLKLRMSVGIESIGGGGGYVGSARKRVELGGTIHRLADASAGNIQSINRSLISTSCSRSLWPF